VNDFYSDLKYSHKQEDNEIWNVVYSRAFPNMVSFNSVRDDGEHQRAGIDRVIVCSDGRTIKIDEKVRRVDYGDILLEYISVDTTGAPGWVEKNLLCDYIAYAVIPSTTCFMLPVVQLQTAWAKNKSAWLEKYGTRSAKNNGYNTLNCPVPVNVLFSAIGQCLRLNWS